MSRTHPRTFLREWRKSRGKTLVQVAEEVGIAHSTLGRTEKGELPYNQVLLEKLAEIYRCDVPDLLMRDPSDPEGMWSLWDRAKPGQRKQVAEVVRTLLRTGTDG